MNILASVHRLYELRGRWTPVSIKACTKKRDPETGNPYSGAIQLHVIYSFPYNL